MTLSQRFYMRYNVDIHCHSVRNRDPWSRGDGDELSSLLLEVSEVYRVPFPLTVSANVGLVMGKGMPIHQSYEDGQGVIPCS